MEKAISKTRRNITIITILVSVSCALLSTFALYAYAESQLTNKINAAKIGSLASENSELSAYIASQEPNHAHFESIAAIIQREDRQRLSEIMPLIIFITTIASGAIGWALSRYLLIPIKESYLAQQRFMQDAAHELRNPLAAMQSQVQRASQKPPTGKNLLKLLTSIERQSSNLSEITTDLLLLERKEYRGKEMSNISELLSDVLEQIHYQAVKKNINIDARIQESVTARIDPQHFVYISKNLIENAIKFSHENKSIDVNLKNRSNGWVLTVKDKGIGIPPSEIDNITQRFYRAKNTSRVQGTGLGMSIVSKFVKMYKGKIDITSKLGRGTTVSVVI